MSNKKTNRNLIGHKDDQEKTEYFRVLGVPPKTQNTLSAFLCFILLCTFLVAPLITPMTAYAQCTDCACVTSNHEETRRVVTEEHDITEIHVGIVGEDENSDPNGDKGEFDDWEEYLLMDVFQPYILPMMMMMTEQLTAVAMHQMMIIGTYFDAEENLETQMLYSKLAAQAHKDYHPSAQMCIFGTNVRTLPDVERRAEYTTFVFSQRSMDRQMGHQDSASTAGPFMDLNQRFSQFKGRFCERNDGNNQFDILCTTPVAPLSPICALFPFLCPAPSDINDFANMDIDFTRVVDRAHTLDLDLTNSTVTSDEQDIFALANNLYSHDVMLRIPEKVLVKSEHQGLVLDVRSIVAKRSVAEHSFNAVTGLRAQSKQYSPGSGATPEYMKFIMENLLFDTPEEIKTYLGDRPSYYAQMDVLTKRIYQQPEFYTNLYDKPANIDRQSVSLQAISLMQDFDTWNSYLRTEAMLSVLLEMEVMKMQDEVQSAINLIRP